MSRTPSRAQLPSNRTAAAPRRLAAAAAALAVAAASAIACADPAGHVATPLPLSQALRALARLMRGKAGCEALREACRRDARPVGAGRQPSAWHASRPAPTVFSQGVIRFSGALRLYQYDGAKRLEPRPEPPPDTSTPPGASR